MVRKLGACISIAPTITSPIRPKETNWAGKEWQRTEKLAREIIAEKKNGLQNVHVKYTLPGPMTIMDGLVDNFYGPDGQEKLNEALVTAINTVR